MNSPCAKVLRRGRKTLVRRQAPPHVVGPRSARSTAQENSRSKRTGCFVVRRIKPQRLENWGARRAAFKPHFLRAPGDDVARGPPRRFNMLGRNEFALRQGFAPGAQNACTAPSAAPRCGAPERKKYGTRKQPVQKDRLFCRKTDKTSALGELGSTPRGFQAVLLTRPRRRCRPGTPEII